MSLRTICNAMHAPHTRRRYRGTEDLRELAPVEAHVAGLVGQPGILTRSGVSRVVGFTVCNGECVALCLHLGLRVWKGVSRVAICIYMYLQYG